MSLRGALLVGGTSSDAGKSLIVAGLCRALVRAGVRVAPFKAQNMSNNSVVTPDGGEIGRAQALQAFACGLEPSVRFNPVLLKPGGDRRSHVVVRGQPAGDVGGADYLARRDSLREVVAEDLAALREEFDVVICEGAGSVAEINLRGGDIANMGLAGAARLPVVLVSDIDRGGSLAHLFGSTAVLSADDQRLICGYLINKFRGDPAILAPGLDQLAAISGRPTFGVVPYETGIWIDAEDSLQTPVGRRIGPVTDGDPGGERLTVAAVRLPRISNSTDAEALACEPGVDVTWVADAGSIAAADLVLIPGTRATLADLRWLHDSGLADAITARAERGRPILAVCGGFQMLSRRIEDHGVEAATSTSTPGLGLFDVDIRFEHAKTLRPVTGVVGSIPVCGYEIHHGRVVDTSERHWLDDDLHGPEGAVRGALWGTHWHGLLGNDAFRRDFLRQVADAAGRRSFGVATDTSYDAVRATQVGVIADLVTAHTDLDRLGEVIAAGPDPTLPIISHRLRQASDVAPT